MFYYDLCFGIKFILFTRIPNKQLHNETVIFIVFRNGEIKTCDVINNNIFEFRYTS